MAADDKKVPRPRMSAKERREQLLAVSRELFGEKGFDGTSIEEIAARAQVSKPVVYEHFGGKEGIYAVVVDREVEALTGALTGALEAGGHPKILVERTAMALFDYIEANEDGFRVLVRDSPVTQSSGTFSSLIGDVAMQVEHLLGAQFVRRGLDARFSPVYAQMLVGMVALTGQYWLDSRTAPKEEVAAHLVNLAWNGLSRMEQTPMLPTRTGVTTRQDDGDPSGAGASGGDAPEGGASTRDAERAAREADKERARLGKEAAREQARIDKEQEKADRDAARERERAAKDAGKERARVAKEAARARARLGDSVPDEPGTAPADD